MSDPVVYFGISKLKGRRMLTKVQIEELASQKKYWYGFNSDKFDWMAFAVDVIELNEQTETDNQIANSKLGKK